MKNIFDSPCTILVNPVNTVSVMGAGLANAFKERFPQMFREYDIACKTNTLRRGTIHMYSIGNGQFICNFPTKIHYRASSEILLIDSSALALATWISEQEDPSQITIAMPRVGCGLGNLDWQNVKPILEKHLGSFNIDFLEP